MIKFNYQTHFTFKDRQKVKEWLISVIEVLNYELVHIDYVFCDDAYIRDINTSHLNHDYVTDIITFDYSQGKQLQAEIYVDPFQVKRNAKDYSTSFKDELHRVLVHGLLHLSGYDDITPDEQAEMRTMEDYCLSLRTF